MTPENILRRLKGEPTHIDVYEYYDRLHKDTSIIACLKSGDKLFWWWRYYKQEVEDAYLILKASEVLEKYRYHILDRELPWYVGAPVKKLRTIELP